MAKINLDVVVRVPKTQDGIKELKEQFRSLAEEFGKIKVDANFQASIKALTDHYAKLGQAAKNVAKDTETYRLMEQKLATEKQKTLKLEEEIADIRKNRLDKITKDQIAQDEKRQKMLDAERAKLVSLEQQYASFIQQVKRTSESNKDYAEGMAKTRKELEETWVQIKEYNRGQSDSVATTEELSEKLKEAKAVSASFKLETEGLTKAVKEGAEAEKALADKEIADELRRQTDEIKLQKEEVARKAQADKEAAQALTEQSARLKAGAEWQRKYNEELEKNRSAIDKVFGNAAIRLWRTWFTEVKSILSDVNDTLTKTENTVIELQRVLNDNATDRQISNALYDLAQRYGQTFENASTIAQNFAKSGMSWNDTIKATESALLAMNVAELNASESSEGLLSIMVQFKKEASELETVVDQLNKTADKNPVTTEKLLKALQRTGSAAVTSNLSLEKTISIITALSAATNRSGQNIGTATNALIMYTQKNLDVFAEMSEESAKVVENFKAGTADVVDIWRAAQDEINKIKNNKTKYNSLLDLFGGSEGMEELNSSLHDELEDTFEQINSVYSIANTYRKNYFIALLDNLDRFDTALQGLEDTQDYSRKENEKYMSTYEAKLNTLTAKWQYLANDEQGLLKFRKGMVDLGVQALDIVKGMGGIVNVVKTVTGMIGGLVITVKSATIAKKVAEATAAFKTLGGAVQGVATAGEAAQSSFGWIGVAITAISLLSGVVDGIITSLQNQRQATVDAAEASRENAEKLADLYSQLNDVDEKSDEYYDILEKIVPLLGDKAEALETLTKDTNEYKTAIENLTKSELEYELAKQQLARDNYVNPTRTSWDQIPTANQSAFVRLGKQWAEETGNYFDTWNQSNYQSLLVYDWIKEQAQQTAQEKARIAGLMSQITDKTSDDYISLKKQYDNYSDDFETYQNIINEFGGQLEAFRATLLSIQTIQATLSYVNGETGGHSGSFVVQGANGANLGAKSLLYGATDKTPSSVKGLLNWSPKKSGGNGFGGSLGGTGGTGGTGSTTDPYLESLKAAVSLRKSELTLMQHQGASIEDQVAKNKEIQEALHVQAEYLRQTGADQAEINALSSEWYNIQENITKLIKSRYTDEIDLAKSRLTLMEHQEASVDKQVEQMKEIQRNLHEEADYLRQIGAEETEINALSSEWWTWQEKILKLYQDTLNTAKELELEAIEKVISSVQEEIDLREEELNLAEKQLAVTQAMEALEEARAKARAEYVSQVLSDYITALSDAQTLDEKQKAVSEAREKYATAQREAQTKAIVEAMKAQKDLGKDALSLEEKRLAVEEARQALIDAQNDRTTRVYDEATGEWHYEANAQNVKSAQEKLADAMQSLDDYLEGEAWDEILDKMEEGSLSEGDILAIIEKWQSQGYGSSEWGNKIIEAYSIAIGTKADPNSVAGELDSVDKAINSLNDYLKNQAIKELQAYIKDGNTSAAEMQAIMDKWLSKGEGGEIWSWSAGVLSEVNRAIQSGKYDDTKIESQVKAVSTAIENLQSYLDKQFLTRIKTLIATGSTEDVWNAIRDAEANGVSSDYIDNFKRQAAYKAEKDSIEEFYKYASAHPEDTSAILKHMEHNSEMWKNSDWKELYADANAALGALIGAVRKNGIWYKNGERLYDSGGVLRGTGGIKGTSRPEGVLDPELTAKILTPRSEEQFNAFVRAMNIMLDHGNRTPSANPVYNNASSVDSHNVTHMINGVPITQDMAQRYTIAELCEVLPILN